MESGREFGPREGILSEREALRVDFLSEPEAKRLLCHYALGDVSRSFDPDVNLDDLLQICGGVPTLLIIAGHELRRRGNTRRGNTAFACYEILQEINFLKEWKKVENLRGFMVEVVLNVLEEPYRDAFLDIAFFFYGWERSKVADIVGEMKLRNLEGAALVTTSEEGKVMMHDMVRARATKLRILSCSLSFQNPLCIVLRDQDIATDEGLINVSDPGGLLDMNEGLLDIDEGVNNFQDAVERDNTLLPMAVERDIWQPFSVLYVINLKELSLRVVVIYKFLLSDPPKTTLAIAVFNLDRKLFRDKDYRCHYCRICMDKDFKPTMTDMEAQSRSDFLINQFRAYFLEAVRFINRALNNVLEIEDSPGIHAPTGNHLRLPLRSKILVTARQLNENDIFGHPDGIQVCSHRVYLSKLYEHTADKRLLYHYASLENTSPRLRNYLKGLLEICEGIPCILKIAGCELKRRGNTELAFREIVEEIQDLKELEGGGHLPQRMVDILYRLLGKDSQDAFMDIAFYFHNWERSMVAGIVGDKELRDLERAALVTTSDEGKVKMDDIVRERGRTLSEGNRITHWKSLRLVLRDKQELEKIKGIWLPDDGGGYRIHTNDVKLMQSLRVLYLGHSTKILGPWKCVRNFEQLRFLCISYEDMLPEGPKLLTLLRKSNHLGLLVVCLTEGRIVDRDITIILPESLQLLCLEVRVPESLPLGYESDFLPSLRIKGHFNSLAESLGSFSCLKTLKLNACSQLKILPENIGNLSSLKILELDNCSDLERLPENIGNLSSLLVLNIRNCSKLKILPENIGNLSSLQRLDMSNCSKMEILPEKIGNLSSLLHLDMSNCSKLDTLPENIGNLSSVLYLDMSNCSMLERLPENIGNLSSLRHLNMSHCTMLLTLPQSFVDILDRRKCAVFLPPVFLPTNA